MKQTALQQVKKLKLLGLHIEENLSWATHVNNVAVKMGRAISVIKRCSFYLNDHTKRLVTQALVLSHLDYSSIIWSHAPKNLLNRLQLVQNRAARLVLGCPYRANVYKMHSKLHWMMVDKRQQYNLLTFFYKMSNIKKPTCLFSRIQLVRNSHHHHTRQGAKGLYVLPRARTWARKSVLFRAISSWNNLSPEIRNSCSSSVFKKKLKNKLLTIQNGF